MNRLDRKIVSQLKPAVQAFFARVATLQLLLCLLAWMSLAPPLHAQQPVSGNASWSGVLRNAAGKPLDGAVVELKSPGHRATSITQPDGSFSFHQLPRLRYALSVTVNGSQVASLIPSI